MNFWRTIEHQHLKPALRRMRPYREAASAGVRVSYKLHLDGGGSTFGQDFVPLLRRRGMPKVARAFEWCAGPGFIGFSLLAQGLCDTLCLADVNPEAIAACQRSIARNRLEAKVAVYLSDNLEGIPASSNGTWWSATRRISSTADGQLRYHDPDACTAVSSGRSRGTSSPAAWVLQENNAAHPATCAIRRAAGLWDVFEQGRLRRHARRTRAGPGIRGPGDTVAAWPPRCAFGDPCRNARPSKAAFDHSRLVAAVSEERPTRGRAGLVGAVARDRRGPARRGLVAPRRMPSR